MISKIGCFRQVHQACLATELPLIYDVKEMEENKSEIN